MALMSGNPIFVPEEVADERLHECERRKMACFDAETGQCKLCSCYVAVKTILATEKCPLGHWQRWFPWTRSRHKRKIT